MLTCFLQKCSYKPVEKCDTVYEEECEVSYSNGPQCEKVARLQCKTEQVISVISN